MHETTCTVRRTSAIKEHAHIPSLPRDTGKAGSAAHPLDSVLHYGGIVSAGLRGASCAAHRSVWSEGLSWRCRRAQSRGIEIS